MWHDLSDQKFLMADQKFVWPDIFSGHLDSCPFLAAAVSGLSPYCSEESRMFQNWGVVIKTCKKESSRNCGQINMVGVGLNDDNLNTV